MHLFLPVLAAADPWLLFLLTSRGSSPLFYGALRPPLGHLHDKTLCGPCVSSLIMPQPPHCALTSGVSRAPLSPSASAGLCSFSVSQMCTWPCKLCLLNPYPDCPGSRCFSTWTHHTLHVVLLANYQIVLPLLMASPSQMHAGSLRAGSSLSEAQPIDIG